MLCALLGRGTFKCSHRESSSAVRPTAVGGDGRTEGQSEKGGETSRAGRTSGSDTDAVDRVGSVVQGPVEVAGNGVEVGPEQ